MDSLLKKVLAEIPEIDKELKYKIINSFTSLQDVIRRKDHLEKIIKRNNKSSIINNILSKVIGSKTTANTEYIYRTILDHILDARFKNLYTDEPPVFLGTNNIAQKLWCQASAVYRCIAEENIFRTTYEEIIKIKGEDLTIEAINRIIENTQENKSNSKNNNVRVIWGNPFSPDPKVRGKAFESLYAEDYISFMYYFKYLNKIIIAQPDGITENFCYEFKRTRREFLVRYIAPIAIAQANLYAYFFKRPKIRVQIYVEEKDEIRTIEKDSSPEEAEKDLDEIINLLDGNQKIAPPKSWKCKNCEYKNYCIFKQN